MKKGGYKIIDFKDINITTGGDAVVITGIYNGIEGSHRKALMLSGLMLDSVEKPDCFIDCTVSDGNYTFTAYGVAFTITNADSITAAAVAAA